MKNNFNIQKFKNSWLQIPEYSSWLRPVNNNKYKGKCQLCGIEFISEISTIKKHLNSAKHQNKIKNKEASNILRHFQPPASASISSMHDKNVKSAEIKLCAFIVEHNISFRTMDHLCPLLSKIFPDSRIAKDLAVRISKSKAIITNVIGRAQKDEIAAILRKTKFSILVDESTDISTTKSAWVVVKYFDDKKKQDSDKFMQLSAIHDHESAHHDVHLQETAQHLFKIIIDTFKPYQIPKKYIIGFGPDGCNVMMGEFNSVSSRFRDLCPSIIIFKCICHSLHICSSQACKTLPKHIENLARNIYNYFKVSNFDNCLIKLT